MDAHSRLPRRHQAQQRFPDRRNITCATPVALDAPPRRLARLLAVESAATGAAMLQTEAIDAWVKKGAQLSPTVKSLMRRSGRRAAAGSAS